MLTTEHPIPLEDVMTILLFSVIWKAFNGFLELGLFSTRMSMVSGTESLISLQRMRPSLHSSKSCIVVVGIGNRFPMSGSFSITYQELLVNATGMRVVDSPYRVDMIGELLPFIFIDRVADIRV